MKETPAPKNATTQQQKHPQRSKIETFVARTTNNTSQEQKIPTKNKVNSRLDKLRNAALSTD